jgi:hypothetical protein
MHLLGETINHVETNEKQLVVIALDYIINPACSVAIARPRSTQARGSVTVATLD